MGAPPLPQRVVRAVGASPVSERLVRAQERAYGPLIDYARRSPLHSGVLGHPIHPALTDVTLGCWTSASLLDVLGGPDARPAATLLLGAGVVAAVPTALAGAGDWAEMSGAGRRIGAVHALGTDTATFCHLASLVLRLRGRRSAAVALGLAGNGVAVAAGFLGAHLALRGSAGV